MVEVDTIVIAESRDDILDIYCTTEEFDAVVFIAEYFDVFNSCCAANAAKGEAIDFVVTTNTSTAVADGDVTDNARIICIVGATKAGKINFFA